MHAGALRGADLLGKSLRGAGRLARRRFELGLLVLAVLALALFLVANWLYQVARKPSELPSLLGGPLAKGPRATWEAYGPTFRRHSTDVVPPTLLAALAQVEGEGNPLARTYWRRTWSLNPFALYTPASSAVGMFQMTDATFAQARRYCIRDHRLVRDGPWHDFDSCWFNQLYNRLFPGHAIELTAAYLHLTVSETLTRRGRPVTPAQQHDLATVIHLCGAQRGELFARRDFRVLPGERCGSHDLRAYVARVRAADRIFTRLAGADPPPAGGQG
jgi:Transglycosylase SLT domain